MTLIARHDDGTVSCHFAESFDIAAANLWDSATSRPAEAFPVQDDTEAEIRFNCEFHGFTAEQTDIVIRTLQYGREA